MKKFITAIILLLFIFSPFTVYADDTVNSITKESTDDDLSLEDDFEDDPVSNSEKESEKEVNIKKESPYRFGGHLKLHSSYNFAHESSSVHDGLSAITGEIMLDFEAKFLKNWKFYINGSGFYNSAYSINGRNDYEDEYLNDYEDDAELKEAYISGSITDFMDIKTGRQIVVWGKSDYIRVTDFLNPLNLQEPGLTDIKDLKIPVAMTKLGFFFSDFSLYTIAVHEHRSNKIPAYGSDFYPFSFNLPNEEEPSNTFRNNEYAVSLEGNFTGWDIAFYYFDGFDDSFHVDSGVKKYQRIKMAGATFNIALGNFLYKAETAWISGLKYSNAGDNEYERSDIFLGFEYTGFTDTTIGFEMVNRHITDYDDTLESTDQMENLFQSLFVITRNFMNETLTLSFVASTFGDGSDGAYQRLTCEYDITDSVKIYGGVIFYKSGDYLLLKNADDNDRIFMDITYSF